MEETAVKVVFNCLRSEEEARQVSTMVTIVATTTSQVLTSKIMP